MNALWLRLAPELRQFPREQRAQALKDAGGCELESAELVGLALWLVLVTSLTRMFMRSIEMSTDASATLMINLLLVAPLLALGFAPIHLRRLRRGLRRQLHHRGLL